MEVTEHIPADLPRLTVVKYCVPCAGLSAESAIGVVAGNRRGTTCVTRDVTTRHRLTGRKAEFVGWPAARKQIAGAEGVVAVIELAGHAPLLSRIVHQCRYPADMRVGPLQGSRDACRVGRRVAIAVVIEPG